MNAATAFRPLERISVKLLTLWQRVREWFAPSPSIVIDTVPQEPAPLRRRREREPGWFTLSELLDGLEDIHESIDRRTRHLCPMRDADMVALRKLGPLVPLVDIFASKEEVETNRALFGDPDKLPAIWSIAWRGQEAEGKDDTMFMVCAYAVRMARTPFYIARQPGICYEIACGYKWVHQDDEHELFWTQGAFFVHEQRIECAQFLRHQRVTLPNGDHYITKRWCTPKDQVRMHWWTSAEASVEGINHRFERVFMQYLLRDRAWTVVSNRGGQRVRFSIPVGRQVYFFKDRDKVALTRTGKRKTILHMVQSHQRNQMGRLTTVRTHVRGARHFTWNGFEIHIFAPGFHGDISDLPMGAYIDDDLSPDEKARMMPTMIDITKVAADIARVQEGTKTIDDFLERSKKIVDKQEHLH